MLSQRMMTTAGWALPPSCSHLSHPSAERCDILHELSQQSHSLLTEDVQSFPDIVPAAGRFGLALLQNGVPHVSLGCCRNEDDVWQCVVAVDALTAYKAPMYARLCIPAHTPGVHSFEIAIGTVADWTCLAMRVLSQAATVQAVAPYAQLRRG